MVRLGLTADTTQEDVDHVLDVLPNAVERLRGMAVRAANTNRTTRTERSDGPQRAAGRNG